MEAFLKDRKILVTGAGRGIGKSLVLSLVHGGAVVYAVTKTQSNLDALVTECQSDRSKDKGTLIPICLDISNYEETARILENIEPLDGLVNNAGIAIPENIMDATKETFESTFNVNVRAVVQITQIVAKRMIAAGKKHGSIVNVSSLGSKRAGHLVGLYAASKATVDRITKLFAVELGPHGIRVNSVNPTVVLTDMGSSLFAEPKAKEAVISSTPLRKMAECEDVVNAILFLLSDKSGMTTGDCMLIDGGRAAL